MPPLVRNVALAEIQSHEERTGANVRLGGYKMNTHCPTSEIQCFHIELNDLDLERLFLLWEPTFIPHTHNRTCRLCDVTPTAEAMAMERRSVGEKNLVDLTAGTGNEPVLVTSDLTHGPLIAIDGNHRLTAHFVRHRRVGGVRVYVGVHAKVLGWHFIPPHARAFRARN